MMRKDKSKIIVVEEAANVKKIGFFERFLSLWVVFCIIIGVIIGKALYDKTLSYADAKNLS